jgi:5S rRNA maturation endonuclease (ribonuclease M5)
MSLDSRLRGNDQNSYCIIRKEFVKRSDMGKNGRKRHPSYKDKSAFHSNSESEKIFTTPADLDRAERLREVLALLKETNKDVPVLVEGKKDAAALKSLGFGGEIITFHRGMDIYDFSEEVAEKYEKIILLMDWDAHGEHLMHALEEELSGHYEEFAQFREILKLICRKEIKDIEGIPSLLRRLEGIAGISGVTEYRKQD